MKRDIYITQNLQRIVISIRDRLLAKNEGAQCLSFFQWIEETIRKYMAAIEAIPQGSERARQIHELIDELILEDKKNADEEEKKIWNSVKCKSGCYGCCYQQVEVTKSEAALIAEYTKANGIEIDRTKLEKQLAIAPGPSDWWKQPVEVKSCLFLSAEGACRIYPVRPIVCRKHFVFTDPKFCSTAETHEVGMRVVRDAELLASANASVEADNIRMPDALKELL